MLKVLTNETMCHFHFLRCKFTISFSSLSLSKVFEISISKASGGCNLMRRYSDFASFHVSCILAPCSLDTMLLLWILCCCYGNLI